MMPSGDRLVADDDMDKQDPEVDQDVEMDLLPDHDATSFQEPLRRSMRTKQPSLRFLETIATSED